MRSEVWIIEQLTLVCLAEMGVIANNCDQWSKYQDSEVMACAEAGARRRPTDCTAQISRRPPF